VSDLAGWEDALVLVPEYMRGGVERYIRHGIPSGGFLEAVMANDFLRACQAADMANGTRLRDWGEFVLYCPNCHGSYERVEEWCKSGGLAGNKMEAVND